MARVLIVDDQPDVREMLTLLLSGRGYDITVTSGGKEALAHLRSEEFDILLSDIRMPELNGMALARIMAEEQPDLAVIMMTAYATVDSVREAARIKVFDYLSKPIDIQTVMDTIDRALAAREAQKQEAKKKPEPAPALAHSDKDKILNALICGVALLGMDGDVYYCNPAAAAMLGKAPKRTAKELFGSPPHPQDTKELSIGGDPDVLVELRVVEMDWHGKPAYLLCMRPLSE